MNDLLDELEKQLAPAPDPVAGVGDLRTLSALRERVPRVIALLDLPPVRLRGDPPSSAVRVDPVALPIAPASLGGLAAIGALSRHADPAALLASLAAGLRPGARIVIAEPLVRSATMRRLGRLLGGPRHPRAPEEITALLLNAGFGEIGQVLIPEGRPTVLTSARLREL